MKNRYGFPLCAIWIALSLVEGAPLPRSYAALVVLLVNCVTCCKRQGIDFKEFEDNFDDELDFSPPADDNPSTHPSSEVYTLAVPPVSLPAPPHLQPPLITEDLAAVQVARHSLSYIQEIGSGWFGKVLLGELCAEPVAIRLVVKELKASAGVKEQDDFLQHADPYRVLQHPNILWCLGQCVETIPFLLVFECCELGDLRSYLSRQECVLTSSDVLQRMACEVAAGAAHLHKNNFLHSDLALRNCFITTDLTVKIGDYGIGPTKYKEDYITTEEESAIPLRWMAPELLSELHGTVLTEKQTKAGNVWALGVTLWELLERAARPYAHLPDRDVLIHVIQEQQIKLCKPHLELPYSDRWYEVLQFCWLPPARRATAEEVHRMLTYLRMQGQRETEEDFEQRWSALKPNSYNRQAPASQSSFPILRQFANGGGEELLTVTETSRGLNFEYVWEAANHDHYSHDRRVVDTTLNYHNMFFPVLHLSPLLSSMSAAEVGSHGTSSELTSIGANVHETPDTQKQPYIQLEKPGMHKFQVDDSSVALDTCENLELAPNEKQHLVLQSSLLGDTSIDHDFFGTSIDSKDSNLQVSQEWSSSDPESPYNANMFHGTSSKLRDTASWNKGSPELRNLNAKTWASLDGTDQRKVDSSSFLGDDQQTFCSKNVNEDSDLIHLTEDPPIDNYFVLHEKCLMKHKQCSSVEHGDPDQDISGAGIPENIIHGSAEMGSGEDSKIACFLESPERILSPKDKLLNFLNQDLKDLAKTESLVPSSTLATGETFQDQLQFNICSSSDPLYSSESGIGFTLDSTSTSALPDLAETSEVHLRASDLGQSAVFCQDVINNITITAAKKLSLVGSSVASPGDVCSADTKHSAKCNLISPPSRGSERVLCSDHEVGCTNYLTGSAIRKISNSLHNVASELPHAKDCSMIEPLQKFDKNNSPLDKPSLQISPPCLDQTNQDSLLDNHIPAILRTFFGGHSLVTPDSMDSLNMHILLDTTKVLNITASEKPQPAYKTADSGYETENVESPEWSSQPTVQDSPAEGSPVIGLQPSPDVLMSAADRMLDALQDRGEAFIEKAPAEAEHELQRSGQQSYRDSAYFSDNDSEPDRLLSDSIVPSRTSAGATDTCTGKTPLLEKVVEMEEQQFHTNVQMDASEAAVLQTNSLLIQSENETDLVTTDDWKGDSFVCFYDEKLADEAACLYKYTSQSEQPKNATSFLLAVNSRLDNVGDAPRLKEPDIEGRYLGKLDSLSVVSGLEDNADADEEDENSDDSDDGNAHVFQQSASSSDSEDDAGHRVPVIVTDGSEACNLRGLLKPTSANTPRPSQIGGSDDGLRTKTVSFFDDVTVYLFDQDTPTKELGDHTPVAGSTPQLSTLGSLSSSLSRLTSSESSTDEEGGGFEWDDDFTSPEPAFLARTTNHLFASRTTASSLSRCLSTPPPSRTGEQIWTPPSSYSRFSVSPSNMARFSLTHFTDSDMEQEGGGCLMGKHTHNHTHTHTHNHTHDSMGKP
ncbi:serine/threonine-protein kinase LMTK2-like isoform X2 [Brienomyrus brachyistius]|uniref:serine/threonine-protein kinase LMTK2-like isoform X2 n=1 Tax=Brienomyrus brachyistius TaxID=42636 RepID=UPI0020B1B500|nr:serine/threonine-protein kinase LMTK2-like isoform X2 [Brienomyrus brachyistius]